jgi:protein-tyrosine phosphatase
MGEEITDEQSKRLFRSIELPGEIRGKIYLHSMPGRYETFELSSQEIDRLGIQRVICLAPREEIQSKSPEYEAALKSGSFDWKQEAFPISDYGAPAETEQADYRQFVGRTGEAVGAGERILIHCGAGIGRTGMTAIAILIHLGISLDAAVERVKAAGAGPETSQQWAVVRRIAEEQAER